MSAKAQVSPLGYPLHDLKTIRDPRGSIVVLEEGREVPFAIRRVYFLHGVPADQARGGHAHRRLLQLLIAASGSFDVVVDDGEARRTVTLDDPAEGLLVTTMVWREMLHFEPGSVCLVLASELYDEADYIRDYQEFLAEVRPIR